MVVNRNKRNKNNKSGNNKDIFGILLMIVSAVFLICLVIPQIFSFISIGIRFVTLGLFGVFSYFLCGGMFAAGLCIFMNKRIRVNKSLLALIIVDFILLMLVLQLATTYAHLDKNFGEYLGAMFDMQYSAGGAVFGIIAYALSALMTTVVAYIVLAIAIIAVSFFIARKLYKKYAPAIASKKAAAPAPVEYDEDDGFIQIPDSFEPQYRSPKKYRSASSLFCERIVTKESRNADFVTEKTIDKNQQPQAAPQPVVIDDNNFGRRMGAQEARSWLYERDDSSVSRGSSESSYREQMSNALYSPPKPKPVPVEPIVPERSNVYGAYRAEEYNIPRSQQMPKKIVHENKNIHNVVLPTPKPVVEDVPGDIVNSSSLFKPYPQPENPRRNESAPPAPQRVSPPPTPEKPKNTGFGFFTDYENEDPVSPMIDEPFIEKALQEFEPEDYLEPEEENPIVSNTILSINEYDFDELAEEEYQPIKNDIAEENINPIISSKAYFDEPDDVPAPSAAKKYNAIKEPTPDENDSPIINSNFLSRNTNNVNPVRSYEPPINDIIKPSAQKPVYEQPVQPPYVEDDLPDIVADSTFMDRVYEPESQEPARSSSFIIDDEVIDKTERDHDFGSNDSGYYSNDDFAMPVSENTKPKRTRHRASEPIGGQLSIEDALPSDPVSAPIIKRADPYYYSRPPMDLLLDPIPMNDADSEEIEERRELIEATLSDLKYPARVINVIKGPTVTRYELQPPVGMSVRKILGKDSDIEYALATKGVRIEAPIAGKQAIGIEVPNTIRDIVYLKDLLNCSEFTANDTALPLALGKDLGGSRIIKSLEKMPHLLVAGATGTGKSVCLNALILSLVYHCSPENMRMVLVDPKCVEFSAYRNLPHLLVPTPIIDPQHTINAFDWAIEEMNNRYRLFSAMSVRNIGEYNKTADVKNGVAAKLPYIVFIVDELADLMLSRKREVEDRIRNITQKSRAAGIHLILATQRPSVDVITGTIKINLPCRIAFSVTTNPDSRTVLDQGGAESLIGNGDMLFMPQDSPDLKRLQGALVTNDEISTIVDYIIRNNKPIFDPEIENAIFKSNDPAPDATAVVVEEESGDDKILPNIMRTLITSKSASTSMIQRRFAFGYARASRIIDIIEQRGWIGKMDGSKPREVFMTVNQFEEVFGRPFNEEE